MSIDIKDSISFLIKDQFPEFYKKEGTLLIAFVEAYYEWMEAEGQVLNFSRNLPEYRDIDKTVEEFIINFKNKYLANIQFNTATNKQLFIKNALEFYRAKGSPRAIDLFFKLVYGLEAKVYYPGDDLFKLSDNEWQNERYLEIIPNPKNIKFVGTQVFGSRTGATAFCERLVRVKKDNQYIEVLYLDGVTTNFVTGEQVETKDLDENITARIDGSLSTFVITASDSGFERGETVYVSDGSGKKAKAIVDTTTNAIGVVDFELLNGGWGYTDQAEILASERVFVFNNLTFENDQYFYHHEPVRQFELIQQDIINVDIDPAANVVYDLPLGTSLYAYENNDPSNLTPIFSGIIVDQNEDGDSIKVNYTAADYPADANGVINLGNTGIELIGNTITDFFTSEAEDGDGASANLVITVDTANNATAINDLKGQANVINFSNTMTIEYTSTEPLLPGMFLFQEEPTAQQRYTRVEVANTFANTTTGQTFANLERSVGWPRTNKPLILESNTNVEFIIENMSNVVCGAIGWQGNINDNIRFYNFANTYGSNTGAHSTQNESFTYSVKAEFEIDTFVDVQGLVPWYSSELMGPELDILINNSNGEIDFTTAIDYVNEGGTVDFANSSLNEVFSVTTNNVSIGSLNAIVTTDPGLEYSSDPFYIVREPAAEHFERYDFYIRYTLEDQLKAFRINEIIFSPDGVVDADGNPDCIARITSHNPLTGEITATRLKVSDRLFANNDNLSTWIDFRIGERITGQASDITAFIEVVDELRMLPRTGLNADIKSEAFNGTGFATSLRILNSGFGYFGRRRVNGVLTEGETLNLISVNDQNKSVQAFGFLGQQGEAPGIHPNRKSFLSSDKYLQDNDFYQEFSYQVLTALPFDKYKQTLIEVLHVAGTEPFGGYVGTSESALDIIGESTTATFNIKQFPVFVNENEFYTQTIS